MAKEKKPEITFNTPAEEVAANYPEAVNFLLKHNVRCIRCGEPLWCSIGGLLQQEKVENPEQLLQDLNQFLLE